MRAQTIPKDEIQKRGWRALLSELGPVKAARFIMQNKLGKGDYTAEREALIGHLSLDEIFAGIDASRGN